MQREHQLRQAMHNGGCDDFAREGCRYGFEDVAKFNFCPQRTGRSVFSSANFDPINAPKSA